MKRHQLLRGILAGSGAAILLASGAHAAERSTANDVIALSNSYAGNAWRQEMLNLWAKTAALAQKEGLVREAPVVNADNSAGQQGSQIASLILRKPNAIVIDAASPTALNGVIGQACSAGITIVSFDSLVSAPCAYKIDYDFAQFGRLGAQYLVDHLHGKGNVLEVRGIAGTAIDEQIHDGYMDVFKKYPSIKVVGSVHGGWTESTAKQAVAALLPSLPEVNAVAAQGGDGVGTLTAFQDAGRPVPTEILGNSQAELALWAKLRAAPGGYETIALDSTPGVGDVAFWVAQQILSGASVPKKLSIPLQKIEASELDHWLKVTPVGGAASPLYTLDWTKQLIQANATGAPLPALPTE
jgi:ribose transport system substrate-binding protein